MRSKDTHVKAILFALLGFGAWVFYDAGTKLVREAAMPSGEVLGFVGLGGLILTWFGALGRGVSNKLRPQRLLAVIACVSFGVTSAFCNIYAIKHLSLTLFFILFFTLPLVISLVGAVFLKEHLGFGKICAIVAGFAGVLVAVNPFGGNLQGEVTGYIAIAGTVVADAVAALFVRNITKTENVWSLTFVGLAVATVVGFASALLTGEFVYPSPWAIEVLLGCAVLNLAGRSLNFLALSRTAISNVGQCQYSQIILGALLGYLVWGEVPNWHIVAGVALIIASSLYITAHARKADTKAQES